MKKVKIMLTAITVMAVVGGALAFNAAKFNTKVFCTTDPSLGTCSIETPRFSISPAFQGQQSAGSSTCTSVSGGNCVERPTYANN